MTDAYKKAYEREKLARQHAEKLLDEKTRVLYKSNVELETTIETLSLTQEQLVQSEKMASIGQLAAGVAHEINNPIGFSLSNLSTLVDYVESLIIVESFVANEAATKLGNEFFDQYMAKREDEDIEFIRNDVRVLLDDTKEGLRRVSDIVANLKQVSHNGSVEKESCSINNVLDESLKVVWNELKYSVDVDKKYSELSDIYCHQNEIHQVLMNMLINAAHACEDVEQGLLKLRTSQVEFKGVQYVLIAIEDNGQGMSKEVQKKIFDPFYTTKPVGVGTGLGLSISFGIIDKHGGFIKVRSEEGEGTTFNIFLPCEPTE